MYDHIVDFYDQIFPLNQAFLKFIPHYLGTKGARVLDLGCGPGDYVDQLCKWGYQAAGIDASAGMIAAAQATRQGEFQQLSFTEVDQLAGKYHCIYCIGNSLSYLTHKAAKNFFHTITQKLSSAGVLIIQTVNWDRYLAAGSLDFPVKTLENTLTFHRRYERIDPGRVAFHTAVKRSGEIIGSWRDTLYPRRMETLAALLGSAGLQQIEEWGDYERAPFNPDISPAAILTGQR